MNAAANSADTGSLAGRHRAVLVVVCLALATVVSAVSALNVALPSVAGSLHTTQTQLSWIVDAYALVFAALLLPGGALGDRYGRRLVLIAGLAIFGAGSIAAMATNSPSMLIAMRAVLGVGAALVMPATLSTITTTFPQAQKPKAVGIWAGVAGASAILGLLASGVLLEWWSWRAVFALNIVLAVVAILGTVSVVPESADPQAPSLDVIGAVISVVGLAALVYSIIEAPNEGWGNARTLVGIALGVVVLAGFVGWESTRRAPLLDPRLFAHPGFTAGTVSICLQFLAFFGFIFLVLQYLQLVRGDRPLIAAVSLLPMAATMMPAARLAPQLAARVGSRPVCVTGLIVLSAALLLLAQVHADSPYWLIAVGLLLLGAGMGAAMTPATSAITDALPAAKQGVGSAMNDLSRELGGALGIAILGSIMQSTYRNHLHPAGLPQPLAEAARGSLALADRIGGPVAEQARAAFTAGLHNALLFISATSLLAAVTVALLLRHQPKSPQPEDRSRHLLDG
ncbi:MFS transporter [Nocardia terpenica]|uniref:MFS transporter n=1 Tax=Nocardia terpenica TaxID=455432 RepID=A0A291RL87_9NOCA|nr:MFS transporter [Nocardia terpenica]ATL67862.1 MFS transporter [Nocardia terpenica]